MTVSKKIGLTCTVLVGLTVGLGVASLVSVQTMNDYQMVTVTDALPGIYYIAEANGLVKDIEREMVTHIASGSADEKSRAESNIAALEQQFRAILKDYEKTITRQIDREMFAGVQRAFERYVSTWDPVRGLSREGKVQEALAAMEQNVVPQSKAAEKAIKDELEQNKNFADECTAGSVGAAASAKWWVGGVLAFSILGGGLGAAAIVRNVNRTLRGAAFQLAQGTAEITAAAAQVSSSSQVLAQGASEQAATLEETSASAEEITAMTRNNADRSRSAADVMGEVARHVDQANGNVNQMIISMSEINSSSEKISKIIKVIDEIAFQTNILALNAAVEAARAGEAGMGFAVVADEVRNLAQRSAQAAKDTAAMIEESIAKSNEGNTKLQHVVEVIRAVTDSAAKVKTLVDEVSTGCQEQARGIEQIAKAVTQMDGVTQTAAATAEQSASSSEELSAQAEALHSVVQTLQGLVGGQQGNVRRPSEGNALEMRS